MHSRVGERAYFIDVSLVLMWRTFFVEKDWSKGLQSGFYWPTLFTDAIKYYKEFLKCQFALKISKQDEMPLQTIFEVEIFDL